MTRAGGTALVAFRGTEVDPAVAELVADPRVAGVTLFRHLNVESVSQTRRLTTELVEAAGRPLLIGVDQEGGQLLGAGAGTTAFAGNMALGAAGDPALTFDVAAAMGRELRALGINVDYAPVADLATRPDNPSLGIRSFGQDPEMVARHVTAFVGGVQGVGVAATLKHFPGKGDAGVDPHDQLPVLDLDVGRLDRVELAPFRAGISAGSRLLMVGHYGLPLITGDRNVPASASTEVLQGLIRDRMGFTGVIVTDALDMGAFLGLEIEAPLHAGADLLLFGPRQAGDLPATPARASDEISNLLAWLEGFPAPDLSVVGSDDHRVLAEDLASRSITLVRDETGQIPIRLPETARILAVMPRPTDLTPADTSSLVEPGLAAAIRRLHHDTTEVVVRMQPSRSEIAGVAEAARRHDLVVVGTISADDAQAALVQALLSSGTPTVTVALRTPYDLARYPGAPTHLCSYGILPPSTKALAGALFGAGVGGRLPVSVPGLYEVGHGLSRESK